MNHSVDPSRGTQHDNIADYRAGYQAGRAAMRGGGGKPPSGCPLGLLLVPVALARLLLARHRAADQPARPDPRPDRLGAHAPSRFRPELVPAPELVARDSARTSPAGGPTNSAPADEAAGARKGSP